MKILLFEGTPQEMKELKGFGLFNMQEPSFSSEHDVSTSQTPLSDDLKKEVVIAALTRQGGVSDSQKKIIKAIHTDGKNGILSSELAKVTGLTPSEVKASMRTIGKRIAHTPGWPQGKKAFEQIWTGMQNIYRLHPMMRAVLDEGGIKL